MNGVKISSSFIVKDILDLFKGKLFCSFVDSIINIVNVVFLSSIFLVLEVLDIISVGGYYDVDNLYMWWLYNNENMNYLCKLLFFSFFNIIFLLIICLNCFYVGIK